MRIGIDYSLAAATKRGMGRYVREIVNSLMSLDNENEYFLYTQNQIGLSLPSNFKERTVPSTNEIFFEQWYLLRYSKIDKLDVLWCPGNTFPILLPKSVKLIVTIHDLIFMFKQKGKFSFRQKIGKLYRQFILGFFFRRINTVFSVSEYSSNQIKEYFGFSDVKITYNCIDSFYKLSKSVDSEKLRQQFYFTVSGDAPSKNLQYLINVFRNYFPTDYLYIAGLSENSSMRTQESQFIKFLDANIADTELISLYKSCKAFIFVSLQEGFGIPILEAMVCNTPIICSNATSLPEVLGAYGQLIDPTNETDLINAINLLDINAKVTPDITHLSKFIKWSNSAQIVLNEFE